MGPELTEGFSKWLYGLTRKCYSFTGIIVVIVLLLLLGTLLGTEGVSALVGESSITGGIQLGSYTHYCH